MKGTRRSKVWLALGLVAAACLVLAGCPHNNLLDGGGTGGGAGNGGGSRGGSDGVQLVITNFVSEEGAANRSASWLGGPQRTIAPEHVDLKGNTDDYVFVASGTGGGTYGPEFINVAQGTGTASLNITGGAVWEITVDAYSVDLLKAANPALADRDTILAGDPALVVAQKDDAQVLTGTATVDIGSGSQVTLTLTNDGVGTEGDVDVDIYFDTPADVDKIRDNSYDVTVALYDYVTGDQIGTTEDTIITGGTAPGNPDAYNTADVPKGRWQFRLEVTDPSAGDKVVAYYVDDINVEGNRITEDEVRIANLFNAPTDPTALKVYWEKRADTDLKDGFQAHFSWAGVSYNAVGIDMEIADITDYYSYVGGQHKVDLTGVGGTDLTLATNDTLWTEIDGKQDVYNAVVTSLSWKDSPQNATRYPAIWKSGSLLNGSNGITFLMQTGHVYSVRIKAAGGQADSGWYVLGDTTTAAPGTGTEFDALAQTHGLFGLVEVTYDLEGKYSLYKTGAGNTIGDKATKDDLVAYHEYDPTSGYTVDKKYNTNMQTTSEGDWFLYPNSQITNVSERIMTWTGWQNKNDAAMSYLAPTWGTYAGHSNLHLIPVGAGGQVTTQSETSGTFDVLNEDTVLISIEANGTTAVAAASWTELANGETNGGGTNVKGTDPGLQKDNTRYILNLARNNTPPTFLYVAVGKTSTPNDVGILTDKNTNDFTVQDISVTLKKGNTDYVVFDNKVTGSSAAVYKDMHNVASGDYTLFVRILASSGYYETYQVPIVVKYNDQVIP